MFCKKCGKTIADNALFCKYCGTELGTSDEHGVCTRVSMTSRLNVSRNAKIMISIFACVLLVLIGLFSCAFILGKSMVSEKAINHFVKDTDFDDVKIGFFLEGKSKNYSIVDGIYDGIDNGLRYYFDISHQNIKDILDEKFVKDFVAEKLNSYIEDFIYESGKSTIEKKEVRRLLEKNQETIARKIGIPKYEKDIFTEQLMKGIEYYDIEEITDLSRYLDDYEAVLDAVKTVMSPWMMIVSMVSFWGIIAGLFVLQIERKDILMYLGISMFVIGGVVLALTIYTDNLAIMLNDTFYIGKKVWKIFLTPLNKTGGQISGLLLTLSVGSFIGYFSIKRK